MGEGRRFVRWQVNRQTKIKVRSEHTNLDCQIEEISLKGLRITSPQKLTKNKLSINIVLGEAVSLNAEVSVVWLRTVKGGYAYGLYFTRIKDIDKEKIYEFLQKNFPEQIKQKRWKDIV